MRRASDTPEASPTPCLAPVGDRPSSGCHHVVGCRVLPQAAEEDVAAVGSQKGAALPHAILLAAAMSVENPFLHSSGGGRGDAAGGSGAATGSAGGAAGGKGSGKGACPGLGPMHFLHACCVSLVQLPGNPLCEACLPCLSQLNRPAGLLSLHAFKSL